MRARSLFWTFAGVFLLVLGVASVLQVVVSLAVLRPLQAQREQDRAELALAHAADELAALPEGTDDPEIVRILRANRAESGNVLLVFHARSGRLVPERALDAALAQRVALRLGANAAVRDDATAAPRTGTNAPPPRRDASAPPRDGAPPPRHDANPPPPRHDASTPPPRDGAPPRDGVPPRDDANAPAPHDSAPVEHGNAPPELLGRRLVAGHPGLAGEVVAIRLGAAASAWSLPESRALLVFLPLAVLAAAAAGLIMVRVLVRRLRALELQAARVAAGDLDARVVDPGADEIGRLGERFNRMTERLASARAELAQTDQQRRRLLADITHELATPLTSIRGYVETLLDPAVPTDADERRRYLEDVLAESERLELLIGDLFDLARLEAGTQPLSLQRIDWTALCHNTTRRFEPRFRDAGLALEWSGSGAEAWLRADGRRLEQVVENLLVNALRYVPAGGTVTLELERVITPNGPRHRLTVSDDGPGIAAADLTHVFERFYRADAVRNSQGSGLGLAIVREIVLRHGGSVHAEARAPHGAAFVVELPPLE